MAEKRRGFGRIRQLPSGRFQAAFVAPDGRLHKAPNTFDRRLFAEGWLADQRRKIDLGVWGAPERAGGLTLAAYCQRWMAQRRLRPRTRALYDSMLTRLIVPALGDVKLAKLTAAKIRDWHTALDPAFTTRNAAAYSLLHAACATAVDDGLLDANPCKIPRASQARRRRRIDPLSVAELAALAGHMPAELRMSVLLAGWLGLRYGELAELRRKDVAADFSEIHVRRAVTYVDGTVHVGAPKTAAGVRTVAVPPHVRGDLAEHLDTFVAPGPEALLFSRPDGGHVLSHHYQYPFEKARAAIGRPDFRVHDLRHTGAVLAAQSGATTAELMHRLGHTTPAAALLYQHVAEGRDALIAQRMSALADADG